MRWDRKTHQLTKYPLEFVVSSLQTEGDGLRLKTLNGYALFHNGEIRRFLHNGIQIDKFPPPPTHY